MLISPAEPAIFRATGTVSSTPEEYGADFLFYAPEIGPVGIQRKEFSDLVNSVYDGRVGKEIAQMRRLGLGIWMIEGKPQWTNDGSFYGRGSFTQRQYRGLMWRLQLEGYWISYTTNHQDSIDYLSQVEPWIKENAKGKASSLMKKPKVTDEWGRAGNKEWAMAVWMNFGLGPAMASRVYDEVGLPLAWTVGKEELMKIKGIGKHRAEKIVGSLNGKVE